MCLYVHGNPLRAGIVKRLLEYQWSSYRAYVDKKQEVFGLTTELVLGMYGGNRRKFQKAQELFFKERLNPLQDLRHGLYLGGEEFSEECIDRLRDEDQHEKPQVRSLLKSRDIQGLAIKILKKLGEKDPEDLLKVRKYRCENRDVVIYILYQLGVYLNKEIGKVFGVGYTAVPGAVKRGQGYLRSSGELERVVKEIIDDI